MAEPRLDRYVSNGVTLLGDESRPGGVTFAFTERTGGVSAPPYASLNFGLKCGDDPVDVAENRHRALVALGAAAFEGSVVSPNQVHGDTIRALRPEGAKDLSAFRHLVSEGCDGVVCTAPDVPVLMAFADCVPVVLVAPRAFAVVHSGWRGTLARISGKAVEMLCVEASCDPSEVRAYVGPHILGEDYEVSEELLARFVDEFGTIVKVRDMPNNLALGPAILSTLASSGVRLCNTIDSNLSTAQNVARFYSYRAEKGTCGRHAAIAWLPSRPS